MTSSPGDRVVGGCTWRRLALPLGMTFSVQLTVNVALLSVAVLAPVIASELGVPTGRAGLFIGLAYLAGALTSRDASRLLAPIGPMTGSLIALAATGAGLLVAATGLLAAMAASAALIGFAYGLTTPASAEILTAAAPPALYGRVFSIKQTAVPVGGFLAGASAPALAAVFGWQGALQAFALAAAALFAVGLPLRRRLDTGRGIRSRNARSPWRLVTARPHLRRLVLAGFALSAVQLLVSTFYTAFLVEVLGFSLALAGGLFGLLQLTGALARVLWGWLAEAVCGLDRALAILAALTAAVLAATALQGPGRPHWSFGVLAVALGLSVMAWTGLYLAAAVAAAPFEASAVTAGAMLFTFAGVALGPPVFGLVVERGGGYASGFAAAEVLAALALALLAMRRRPAEDVCHDDAPDPPPSR